MKRNSAVSLRNHAGILIITLIIIAFIAGNITLKEVIPEDAYSSNSWSNNTLFALRESKIVPLPKVLTSADINNYKAIFTLQHSENWKGADNRIKNISNNILLGHVKAQRLLHPYYNPRSIELGNWLNQYSDHPQAYKIYKLAAKIDPTFKTVSKVMQKDYLSGYGDGSGLTRSVEHSLNRKYWGSRSTAYNVWKKVHYHIRRGRITYSLKKFLQSEQYKGLFSATEEDMLKQSLAHGYFAYKKNQEALAIAEEAILRSGNKIPSVYWVAGVSAWRLNKWEKAADYFFKLSSASEVPTWKKAAGGFWAYRAYKKTGDTSNSRIALKTAYAYPKTFYGTLAAIAIGRPLLLEQEESFITQSEINELLQLPNVKRAFALKEVGSAKGTEDELRKIYPKAPLDTKKKLLGLTHIMNIPGLEIKMASRIAHRNEGEYDLSLYPVPYWQPEDGFTVNPALLLAFARHESGFNPAARSHVGAQGLMQLMPKTANYIAKKGKYKITPSTLLLPEKNLTVGQDYLEYLLSRSKIKGNLFFMAAAYNAGPNTLFRWLTKINHDDPLLFVESIPSKETRDFIKRIMSNYWIYRERLGYNTPSLHSILEGEWPIYEQKKKEKKQNKLASWKEKLCPICL